MNQIEFLGSKNNQDQQRMEENRPSKIVIDKSQHTNKKWIECKILGQNISIRSYSAACSH